MKKLNVLIADANKEFRSQIFNYFRGTEHINIAWEAEDGITALEKIDSGKPDVVILDLVLPGLDGYGVLKQLKMQQSEYKPYIIVCSQLHTDMCITRALSDGADFYLLKPLNLTSLHEHLALLASSGTRMTSSHVSESNNNFAMPLATAQSVVSKPKSSLDEKLANIFISVGIPAHIKGYQYLREAIKLSVETPEIVNNITKQLYPQIAESFSTTPSKVERAIRHAIEVACSRGKIENLNNIFGMRVFAPNEKPTNGEFIALIADKMLIEGA